MHFDFDFTQETLAIPRHFLRQEVESFLRQGVAESTAERYDRNAHEWQEFVGSRGFGHDPG